MLLSCKRIPTYDELLEPLWKRYRLDVPMDGPEDCLGGASSSATDPCLPDLGLGRRQQMDDISEEPVNKRFRTGDLSCNQEEATVRRWAETIVQKLHGCPSVEEAAQRCGQALVEFGTEVRQAALREVETTPEAEPPADVRVDVDERGAEGSPQNLQHTNKVLMRAVHHLAERCRRLEATAAEIPALQQALEQSQDTQRRLQHSNEVLQEHLKVHLNSFR